MAKQLSFEKELHLQLNRFDERLTKLRLFGLKLWTGVLRAVANDLESARVERDKRLYQEVMLLESDMRALFAGHGIPAEGSAELLDRLGKLKGLLSVGCLVLICWSVFDTDFDAVRPCRGRRRNEEVLVG